MIALPARQAGALDIITVCALGLAGPGIQAHADQLSLWGVGVGVVALDLPDYPGADERTNYVLPLPFFAYRGDVFKVDRDGVRGLFFKTDAVELDVSLNASVPVCEGVVFQPQLTVDLRRLTPLSGWRVGAAAGPMFGDSRYNAYYYSVAPVYATPTRPAYTAPGEYAGSQLILSTSRRFPSFWVGAFAHWIQLSGAVFEDSPLVKRQQALSFGFAVAWMFKRSATLVEADD